jgi:hypothetical protein
MNLHDICLHVNNFFKQIQETTKLEFSGNKITGMNTIFLVGQYVYVEGSLLNDGVYKITAVGNKEITIDADLETETNTCTIFGLAIPKAFIELANEIINEGKVAGNIKSESVSRYSVTYAGDGSDWIKTYKNSLDKWRKLRGF